MARYDQIKRVEIPASKLTLDTLADALRTVQHKTRTRRLTWDEVRNAYIVWDALRRLVLTTPGNADHLVDVRCRISGGDGCTRYGSTTWVYFNRHGRGTAVVVRENDDNWCRQVEAAFNRNAVPDGLPRGEYISFQSYHDIAYFRARPNSILPWVTAQNEAQTDRAIRAQRVALALLTSVDRAYDY